MTGRTSGVVVVQSGDVLQADPGRQDGLVRVEAAAVRQDELGPDATDMTVPASNVTPAARHATTSAPSSARLST